MRTDDFPDRQPPDSARGAPADLELDSVAQRPESPPFSVAINYDSIVSSAKATGLRGGFCEKVQEKIQNRDARRSGFRLLRSRPRRKHSGVSRRPRRTWNEVRTQSRSYKVLPTQETLDRLADRIERAFTLRCSNWYRGCSTPRIWSAAATILWEVQFEDPTIPLDPELFVASQPLTSSFADPWSSLAQPEAGHRYRQSVRRIIRRLRTELKREIRRTEDLLRQGRALSMIIASRDARLSPLGLYIAAHRAARPDLAGRVRPGAIEQHNCCPLYRSACMAFLPAELYPMEASNRSVEAKGNYKLPREIGSCN